MAVAFQILWNCVYGNGISLFRWKILLETLTHLRIERCLVKCVLNHAFCRDCSPCFFCEEQSITCLSKATMCRGFFSLHVTQLGCIVFKFCLK